MPARRKYNWEEWFGQDSFTLVRGVDYHCSQSAMVQNIRNKAVKLGVRVNLEDAGDRIRVWIYDMPAKIEK